VAAKGMLGDLKPLGDSPCRSLADGCARVPKVLPTAELEGFLTGLIIAMPLEPVGGAAVGDDVPGDTDTDSCHVIYHCRRRPSGPRGAPGAAMRAQTKVRDVQDLRGHCDRRRKNSPWGCPLVKMTQGWKAYLRAAYPAP